MTENSDFVWGFLAQEDAKDHVSEHNEEAKVENKPSMVNHPPHYQTNSGLEVIEVIEAFELGFCLGNVVKYILRAGHKGGTIEDLEKAQWYLEREIRNQKPQS